MTDPKTPETATESGAATLPSGAATERWVATAVVAAAAMLCLLLMSTRLGEPFGGYLAFNEGWYALLAHNFQDGSWLTPQVAPGRLDLNLPPLFGWLAALAFWMFGELEAAARGVSVLAGMLVLLLTARIAWRLGGARAGAVAAATLATMPLFVVVSRNAQTEALYVALSLLAFELAHLLRNRRSGLPAAGLVLGLALLAKPFAMLLAAGAVLGWLSADGSLRRLRARHGLLPLGAVIPPAAYYLYQYLSRPEALGSGLATGERAFEPPTLRVAGILLREACFSLGPFLLPAIVFGVVIALRRREAAHRLLLALLAVFALFYLFIHYHSYYPYAVAPVLATLVGVAVAGRRVLVILALLLALLNAGVTVTTLGAIKYGRSELQEAALWAREQAGGPATFFLSPDAYWATWTVVAWYGGGPVYGPDEIELDQDQCLLLPYHEPLFTLPPVRLPGATTRTLPLIQATPVLFGVALEVEPVSPHLFAWKDLKLRTVGSIGLFTWIERPTGRVLHVSRLPDHTRVCLRDEGITLVSESP